MWEGNAAMKTIGMIGGLSWQSSIEYYRIINQQVNDRLGSLHSGKIVLISLDFAKIESLQVQERWDEVSAEMIRAAQRVEAGGADFLLICTNTLHMFADEIQTSIDIPLLHIADAAANTVQDAGLTSVALLGTRYTMDADFYKKRLREMHHLNVLIPNDQDRLIIDRVIYNELVLGIFKSKSRNEYIRIIEGLVEDGAEGVILGCTEIGLLVSDTDLSIPLFDTAKIHALRAAELSLSWQEE